VSWRGAESKAANDKSNRRGAKTVFYNIQECTKRGEDGMETSVIHDFIEKKEQIEMAARALKAISHPLRLKILCVVGAEEVCVQDIVDAVGTSQSNISQHLGILRDKGVLQTRKDANRVYYRVADQRTLQLIVLMREVFCGVPGLKN
jgi:DNA-binding transcriptional ArsR family regulator